MDTSETYIKMRLAAVPDLGMGTPPDARGVCWRTDIVFTDAIGNWYFSTRDKCCQLERQDQLQEMVTDNSCARPWVRLCGEFYKWAHLNWCDFASMEQLWLAFVMKETYNKVWNGEKWINDKTGKDS